LPLVPAVADVPLLPLDPDDPLDADVPLLPDTPLEPLVPLDPEDPELPDEPKIQIWDISLESINSGELKKMAPVLQQAGVTGIDYSQLRDDMESPEWKKIEDLYRGMRHLEAARHNEEATIRQWRESVTAALGVVTSRTIRNLSVSGMRTEKSFAGDVKKRINRMKKIRCGEITEDIEVCKRHYAWLKALEREIIENGVPSWLQ